MPALLDALSNHVFAVTVTVWYPRLVLSHLTNRHACDALNHPPRLHPSLDVCSVSRLGFQSYIADIKNMANFQEANPQT